MYQENFITKIKLKSRNKTLTINGSKYIINSKFTVLELINYLGFNKSVIVIDYNGIIVQKKLWGLTFLNDKDSLEILSIAGGG